MKCQRLLSRKYKKNVNLSSAKFPQRLVNIVNFDYITDSCIIADD